MALFTSTIENLAMLNLSVIFKLFIVSSSNYVKLLFKTLSEKLISNKMRVCAVLGCPNKGVYSFPRDNNLRMKWVEATKVNNQRKTGWKLSKHSSLCSGHFEESDFFKVNSTSVKQHRKLKRNAVPSVFPWTIIAGEPPSPPIFDPSRVTRDYSRRELPLAFAEEVPFVESTSYDEDDPLFMSGEENENLDEDRDFPILHNINLEDQGSPQYFTKSTQTNTETQSPFSIHNYKHNNKAIHFYTGLVTFERLLVVYQSLGENVHKLKYLYGSPPKSLSALEQFFMTLIIFRRHTAFEEIAMLFLITIKQVYNIFITWVRFMALQWRNIDLWIDRETVHAYAPLDFFDKYPMTRTVLDATECPVKKPNLPLAQQITFSNYKNRNTVKALIGITPSGLISYISPCYGGSATDRQIIERSSILNRFDFNDEIMVDKGLNVQDIFLGYGVKVNMPSFFKRANQINPSTLVSDRKVASKRVHVERIIGMLKTYKILTQPMNKTETLLSSDIMFICAMLVNFRPNVINKNA